jgi:ABC-type glycerol-3-phosphate transport system permease component
MPIISKIEAKSLRGRLLYAAIFLVLSLGGLTMVYPFVIMVSGSLRSEMDESNLDIVPTFLVDEGVLQRKFRETKYNQNVSLLNRNLLAQDFSFAASATTAEINPAEVAAFRDWLTTPGLPDFWFALGGTLGVRTTPEALRELRERLSTLFGGSLEKFTEASGAPISSWSQIVAPAPDWVAAAIAAPTGPVFRIYEQMQQEADPAWWMMSAVTGRFLAVMIYPAYGQLNTAAFNETHGTELASFADFRLPRTVPAEAEAPVLRAEWIEYVTSELNASFVRLPGRDDDAYRRFLAQRYGTVEAYNRTHDSALGSFDEIRLPDRQWMGGLERDDYRAFLLTVPPEEWVLDGPEYAWRDHLLARHGSLEAINAALGTDYPTLEAVYPPMAQLEAAYVAAHSGTLRWDFATRNFRNVFDELFQRGRAFTNTVIVCVLAVASALLINPLAAYAMSRMKLPGTYKIIMILMATIAFPSMVQTIPTFIILREAGLLNTFFALVLPGIANGYLIFMLKGFFDSLPQELYEAATIDGASEIRIFFQITMALSKPILAVVALGAFNNAYSMFLYALIVAPDPNMWVLNVWLYQWQQSASTSAMFASVLVASIPTLLVFLVAQNIIMRGIVVPTEK